PRSLIPWAEHLADVPLAVPDHLPEPPGQLQRLVLRPDLKQREADDYLFGFGERPVGQRDVPAGRGDVRAAVQAARGQQHPGPGQLLDEAPHLGVELLIRRTATAIDRHQEAHHQTSGKFSAAVSICPGPRSKRQQQAGPQLRPTQTALQEETTMRKIVAGLFISLDGVVEAADQWMGPWFNAELGQTVGSLMAEQDAMLLGRVTYQEFAG